MKIRENDSVREDQRNILDNYESEYISIGVTENGESYSTTHVPWDKTSSAFNMKIPRVFISKDDLKDPSVLKRLSELTVVGMYIYPPLESYEFLSRFPSIKDLNIMKGENIKDLSFLRYIPECRMLYIEDASAPDLLPIVENKSAKSKTPFLQPLVCVGLCDCKIEDISAVIDRRLIFTEFIVWGRRGSGEGERWCGMSRDSFRYYELDLP